MIVKEDDKTVLCGAHRIRKSEKSGYSIQNLDNNEVIKEEEKASAVIEN